MRQFKPVGLTAIAFFALVQCTAETTVEPVDTETKENNTSQAYDSDISTPGTVRPEIWPVVSAPPLDPAIEARIDDILSKMTLEQKVGQTLQADSASVTPEEVKAYRLGSVLSGGNSAPGPKQYADAATWLEAADAYYNASVDPEGVEVAIPIIWGIDAVHGHTNLKGGTVFPHNIGLGAARNPDLIESIARVTAKELSVSGHDWTFAPTLAVPRDDRWGRAYEGFSEAPEITASYADRIVYGLQGHPGADDFMAPGRVISAAKHFLADGGTLNGTDQGDSLASEEELRDIHAAGYLPALSANVQSVMISFSSWQGVKMTGNKGLITDVLKERMGFNGIVISDWNAHGQIPGCTNTDCPQALNAGIDMYMAPDSWKGLYESTLVHLESGRISEDQLDEAVRRILRVKLQYGLFEKGAPSTRPLAGDLSLLGSAEHRNLARQAVRESLVLLKNEGNLLPLDAGAKILVVGDGADKISKAAGGWTLSWQGKDHTNDEFPNGESILAGIKAIVEAKGGSVEFDPEGTGNIEADIVIAVYGEDPYAEFQGDRSNVDFEPNGFDTNRLSELRSSGAAIVSVFLSGRPMWTNPEINDSDAFIAAWLPGAEGGGVADMLFRTDPAFEFTGRLPFSWPKAGDGSPVNVGDANYDPLFAYGYGLNYGDTSNVGILDEDSGNADGIGGNPETFFSGGQVVKPWSLFARIDGSDFRIGQTPFENEALVIQGADRAAQEDSLRLDWRSPEVDIRITTFDTVDFSRQKNAEMELAFFVRNFGDAPATLNVGMGCHEDNPCRATVPVEVSQSDWQERRISLSCFADRGVDMSAIGEALFVQPEAAANIGLSSVRLATNTDGAITCGT